MMYKEKKTFFPISYFRATYRKRNTVRVGHLFIQIVWKLVVPRSFQYSLEINVYIAQCSDFSTFLSRIFNVKLNHLSFLIDMSLRKII